MSEPTTASARVSLWRSALFGPMPLSYPLIAACVLYYLLGVVLSLASGGFHLAALADFLWAPADPVQIALGGGGLAPLAVWQVWTLVDSSFLHLNLPHIAVNMFCLFQIMPAVEAGFGRLRAFIIYILAGIGGSLGSALWGEFYSLGASGAIFGLLGAVLVYGLLRRDDYGRHLMLYSLKWAGLNFAFGLFGPVAVSNAAHAGGFIGGILGAFLVIYRIDPRKAPNPRWLAGLLACLTVLCLAIGVGRATWASWQALANPAAYQAGQNEDMLAKANAVLSLHPGNAEILALQGQAYARKGDYTAALGSIDLAITHGLDTSGLRRMRAQLYAARGQASFQKRDYAGALADVDAALGNGLDTPQLHSYKAWLLATTGRTADALAEAQAVLAKNPSDAGALNIRAHLYETMGSRDQAIADYQAALRLNPKDENSRQGLQRLTGGM